MDRDYWRSQSDTRLIDEARSSGHELCIALGERLDDQEEESSAAVGMLEEIVVDLHREIERLNETIFQLKRKK